MGRMHIAQKHAVMITEFYRAYPNPYLNYHRPCGFATETISEKGKIKKVYNLYRTPFDAFVGHPDALKFLKDSVTLEKLDGMAHEMSDNECAVLMQEKKYHMKKLDINSDIFTRGADDIITKDELAKLLGSKKQIRVKLGIDATSPDLHIGHAVPLWKIRALQDAGHKAVIILGEFTTRIGDPTGKDATRPVLTPEVIRRNVAGLKKQLGSILLMDKAHFEFRSNAQWHGKMKEWDFLNLCAMVTHSRLIERDMFQERMKNKREIAMTELLYPLLQGYDSVAIQSDITIIGSDQLFNEHFGRFFQEKFGQQPQTIVTLKILPGLDGGAKMSKSLGNYIALNDTPMDKFGKAMRLLDPLIIPYLEVYTDMPLEQIRRIEAELKGGMNPRDAKLIFAETLVERYHGEATALKAREQFLAVFSKKELPQEIQEFKVHSDSLIEILVEIKFASSKAEARRLIKQGGVEVDGKRIGEEAMKIDRRNGTLLRVGKRKIGRLGF